jgi:transposase-like protein
MFTYQKRIKAVQLLIQYDMSYATVIRELGYPSKGALINWYKEYIKNGDLHEDYIRKSKGCCLLLGARQMHFPYS